MKPKFQTDREGCGDRYLGTYFDCDLYVTNEGASSLGPSLIVRFGEEGCEYSSSLIQQLRRLIVLSGNIGLGENKSMPYRDWVLSDRHNLHTRIMYLGLLILDSEKAMQCEATI